MLTPDELERERCESRQKAQLDYNTGLKVARMEGFEEGFKEGLAERQQVGVIHFCEGLLGRQETPRAQLYCLGLDKLTSLADDLEAQVRKAHPGLAQDEKPRDRAPT
jgi:flagellar biosynthesis/type III secretory pathway protein FliH